MSSGIELDKDATALILNDNKGDKYKYVIFKIDDTHTKIIVDKIRLVSDLDKNCQTVEADKEEFRCLGEILPQDSMRYILYTYVNKKNIYKRSFIKWLGPNTDVKVRMLYTTSESAIKSKLGLKPILIEDEFRYPHETFQEEDPQDKFKH